MKPYFLDDPTFAQFRAYIYELTGIDYTESKRYLLDTRVRRRARETDMEDGAGYLHYLKTSADSQAEIDLLIDQVATHETSFFRHANQINTFEKVVGELIAERRLCGQKDLNIWSAACSTGEEPYTLAMVVHEQLNGESDWAISVQGTDISSDSITRARRARFAERRVHNVPEAYMAKYFRQDQQNPNFYTLVPELANAVQFDVLSLIDDDRATVGRKFDIIFCRNLLIYFDDAAKKKVLATLWQSLAPGGYLVLGPSDSLHELTDAFQRTQYSVCNFFQRGAEPPAAATPLAAAPAPQPSAAASDNDQSLHLKLLIQRLDRGIRDLSQDLNDSLGKTIDAISAVTNALEALGKCEGLDPGTQTEMQSADHQLMRVLLHSQVGDRTQQKTEALRATLQELSDRLLGAEEDAPDLRVSLEFRRKYPARRRAG